MTTFTDFTAETRAEYLRRNLNELSAYPDTPDVLKQRDAMLRELDGMTDDAQDIIDHDEPCYPCRGTGVEREKTQRGTYLDEDCYYCRGTGRKTVGRGQS